MTIKPCPNPFCGGEASVQKTLSGKFYLECDKCLIPQIKSYPTKEVAIAAWNNRPGELNWQKFEECVEIPKADYLVVKKNTYRISDDPAWWADKFNYVYYLPLSELLKTLPK
jgi:hypothetical protein